MNYENKYKKYKTKYTKLKQKINTKFNIQNAGFEIPKIGLGTWQEKPNDINIFNIILKALEIGYRCFDCALNYHNQTGIGNAFQYAFEHMNIKRTDLFIIGKGNSYDELLFSLSDLKLEYFDLALIHHKYKIRNDKWTDFIKLKKEGKTNSIGLSNIYLNKLIQFNKWCDVNNYEKPSAIESEINIFNPEQEFVNYCNNNNIKIIAYTPLVQMSNTIHFFKSNEILNNIKNKYKLSFAQLLLLWAIKRNITVIPASSNELHMCENLSVKYIDDSSILTLEEINEITNCIGMYYPIIETAQEAKIFDTV